MYFKTTHLNYSMNFPITHNPLVHQNTYSSNMLAELREQIKACKQIITLSVPQLCEKICFPVWHVRKSLNHPDSHMTYTQAPGRRAAHQKEPEELKTEPNTSNKSPCEDGLRICGSTMSISRFKLVNTLTSILQ